MIRMRDRWLLTIAIIAAALMPGLATTIVSMSHMQGSLGVNPEEISWTLTSYLVASAIMLPLTGYLADRFGTKHYFIFNIAGFIIASTLCGVAHSLAQIVLFRLLQGLFGAALLSLSQTILADLYSNKDRGIAMALWGMAVILGPILGPTLASYFTDYANWRWGFYFNIPIGLLSLLIIWYVIPDTQKSRKIDWIRLLLLSIAVGATQYFLDRGEQDDWWDDTHIQISAFLGISGLISFLLYKHSSFDLRIFKDRNFVLSTLLMGIFSIGFYSMMVSVPVTLESFMDYPIITTDRVTALRGISALISMLLAGYLLKKIDPRWIILSGIIICAGGMWKGLEFNLAMGSEWIVMPLMLQGFGLGWIFTALSFTVFATLPKTMRAEAAGFFNLFRLLGNSIGISLVSSVLARQSQVFWNHLRGFVQPHNLDLKLYLKTHDISLDNPSDIIGLGKELYQQSQMNAFDDIFFFIAWSFVVMLPLIFLLKKPSSLAKS